MTRRAPLRGATCPRSFEVEAARDGRLTGAELATFERHLTVCAGCRGEAKALEDVADALRVSHDTTSTDMLHVRRERTRLLAAFDRALLGPAPTAPLIRWRAIVLAVAVAAALGVGVLVVSRTPPSAVVQAGATAQWSERQAAGRDEIHLRRGTLSIHVDHPAGAKPLVVVLPDGELEDVGTTFTIDVEDGHTAHVSVEEGRVELRLRDRAPFLIRAGESWPPAAAARVEPTTPPSAAAAASLASDPSAAPASREPAAPRRSGSAAPASEPATQGSVSAASSAPIGTPDDAGPDFRAAMAAFDAGHHDEAAAAFASFLRAHPRDPRAEDAAYLRVIALQRSGDPARTRAAAQNYLERYPSGFRRAEMETLAR